ncbi:citrate lyase subunit alpha / citrate CoA-transferase [Cohaesibacter sp. ES.047]|uniref:citrate lyase subunit alpha n=1 Tax=Cohaesibacter sp. ES.047 TaxID=1798205 RepID=UPI000BB8794A|nr:citrate lyase subunit alpha [Cohaesibacter sp. ES.047]SNY93197.1 citrate lyase subunit alpha / citrate CoA-transferase [Cohaesibacter sp. ES.047]
MASQNDKGARLSALEPYAGFAAHVPYLADEETKLNRKLVKTVQEAVKLAGLEDGMTISFHHAFREGDKVINMVVGILAEMGFHDLTLASSSLVTANSPLIEHIKSGVIRKIFTSGMRGKLADAISHGLMDEPITIHSHGGRVALIERGEIEIDLAFLGVSACDPFGNANGVSGRSWCGSLGYAMVDAHYAKKVIMLAEDIVPFPNTPASIRHDQVDYIVQVDEVGDPAKISVGAARATTNPRELLIARLSAEVMVNGGYFEDGFSMQTGTGGSSTATVRFIEDRMRQKGIKAAWALGGQTGGMVDLHEKGLIDVLLDTQSFDSAAARSLESSSKHVEISTHYYANPLSKGAVVDRLDMVILSALEIDLDFNVNVLTGSDGVMRGASGGHCDAAAGAKLSIVAAPLIRSRIPTVVEKVTTRVTPGETIGVLVTDHGIAVNPNRPDVAERLKAANLPVMSIEELHSRAINITGKPKPIEFLDKVVGIVRYRDGTVIDQVHQVAS